MSFQANWFYRTSERRVIRGRRKVTINMPMWTGNSIQKMLVQNLYLCIRRANSDTEIVQISTCQYARILENDVNTILLFFISSLYLLKSLKPRKIIRVMTFKNNYFTFIPFFIESIVTSQFFIEYLCEIEPSSNARLLYSYVSS